MQTLIIICITNNPASTNNELIHLSPLLDRENKMVFIVNSSLESPLVHYNLELLCLQHHSPDELVNYAILRWPKSWILVLAESVVSPTYLNPIKNRESSESPVIPLRSGAELPVLVSPGLLNKVGGIKLGLGDYGLTNWLNRLHGKDPLLNSKTLLADILARDRYVKPLLGNSCARVYIGIEGAIDIDSIVLSSRKSIVSSICKWCSSNIKKDWVVTKDSSHAEFSCVYPNSPLLLERKNATYFWPWKMAPPEGVVTIQSSSFLCGLDPLDHHPLQYPYLFCNSRYREARSSFAMRVHSETTIPKHTKVVAHLHCYDLSKLWEFYGKHLPSLSTTAHCVVTFTRGHEHLHRAKKVVGTLIEVENRGFDLGGKFAFTQYCHKNATSPSITHYLFLHSKSCSLKRNLWFSRLVDRVSSIKPGESVFADVMYLTIDKKRVNIGLSGCDYEPCYDGFIEACSYYDIPEPISLMSIGNCFIVPTEVANRLYMDKKVYSLLSTVDCFDQAWFTRKNGLTISNADANYCKLLEENREGNAMSDTHKEFRDGQVEHILERIVLPLCLHLFPEK